jgi:hypothetical protein
MHAGTFELALSALECIDLGVGDDAYGDPPGRSRHRAPNGPADPVSLRE